MMKRFFSTLIVVLAISGCASVPMSDPKNDAQAKKFTVTQDKSGIYIYRNEFFGAAVRMDVSIDGENLGKTAANTYFYKEVSPGKHVISSTAENTDTLEIEVKPGKLAFIWQEVKMGLLYARNKLHLVSEEEGKKGVQQTNLATSN